MMACQTECHLMPFRQEILGQSESPRAPKKDVGSGPFLRLKFTYSPIHVGESLLVIREELFGLDLHDRASFAHDAQRHIAVEFLLHACEGSRLIKAWQAARDSNKRPAAIDKLETKPHVALEAAR